MDLDRGFTLGEWTVLPRQSLISAGDVTRHLEPKVMAVLVCLAKAAPETVLRSEIFDEVWPRVVVQDEVLSRNISILRSNLALDGKEHKYIQTIPRVGYRLLDLPGEIESQPTTPGEPGTGTATNDSPVTPTPGTLQAAALQADTSTAAELSHAPASNPLSSRARVLATVCGSAIVILLLVFLWHQGPGDLPPVDQETRLPEQTGGRPENATALSAHMILAGYSTTERRGADYLNASVRLFRDALTRDPEAISAHLGIANALALLPSYAATDSELAFAQAINELQKYVEAGGAEGQTHATAAFIELHRMHFIAAEERFQRAIGFDPDDAGVHQWYSQLLARVGHLEKSATEAALAVELDPASPVNQHRRGVSLLWQGQTADAARQFDMAAAAGIAPFINPEPRYIQLFRNRQFDELVAMLRLIQSARGMTADWIEPLQVALKRAQPADIEMALAALEEAWQHQQVDASLYFGVPLFLGDADFTFKAAVAASRGRSAAIVLEGLFLPEAAPLRAHPLFASLVQELGLTSYWVRYGPPDVCRNNTSAPAFCNMAGS
ncbi:MAG: winged helix-turn-helix domain-containing protein [Pseudomonadota bacterium]